MTDSLRVRVGAVILVLVTMAAIIFGVINFRQRAAYDMPDDGVTWWDTTKGVVASKIAPNSPAVLAGIKPGDRLISINDNPMRTTADVTQRLWRVGLWTEVRYQLSRDGSAFTARLVTAPQEKPLAYENFLRIVGLVYLFIGFFIFARRWNAPRALHFYIFCLVSFIFYSFHYSGKLNSFDQVIFFANTVAWFLQPALLLHFALVFPERHESPWRHRGILALVYGVPAALAALYIAVFTGSLGFVYWLGSRIVLDEIRLIYLGLYFVIAAVVFYISFRRAPSGILRQQLKWACFGTFAVAPFVLTYIPLFIWNNGDVPPWAKTPTVLLVLMPLCFAYAIIRYRLMDVDIIFKRGLAYTAATAGVVVIYFLVIGGVAEFSHTAVPAGPVGGMIAIVLTALLLQPFRDWTQRRLDRFFYRDRLDFRRTLIEFGRTLTNEVHLEPMLGSVMDRISQTLLVDRMAIFLVDEATGRTRLSRSLGMGAPEDTDSLDYGFLDPTRAEFLRGYLFYESPRYAEEPDASSRRTLERLDLNYYIPCRIRERTVAVLGLGKTVDGDFLSSDDVELLFTIAGYVAIALDNAHLYSSLEQKAAQIERLKDFSENIVESLHVGVFAVDLEGRVESWNTQVEALLGVPRKDAIGCPLDGVLPTDLVAEIEARADEENVSSIYKFAMRNRDGRMLVVNVSITPLLGKDGQRLGRLILVDDVSQRARLEDQLMQTEKLTSLGLLAAGVAHEVNTPLAVISNYIQMLARQFPGDDPRHTLIEKIVKQTFRASEIVNNLLNFSRVGSAQFSEVSMNAVVEETLSLVTHPLKTARIEVVQHLQGDLPPVLGSMNRLQQVFLNLFMNARDAMPAGGVLDIRTACSNGTVEVEVSDTGVGIPRDQLHRIFDPFFTTKSTGRGTGLGLSVSYGIIKEHAGKIDVKSAPGRGTQFRLEFPVARKAAHV
ncbi:MAG TPA: ATP-binding protein [Candidatus Acidoferrales bacterium]|jgi:PAS domain S-box-containing protein|nr:ATP-binding protein [Candidatus Acidoferrales bacterium]